MHRIVAALSVIMVVGVGVARAQTVTIITATNILAACPATPSAATDRGLFVYGNAQAPYNYTSYLGADANGPSVEFVPPASASDQWAQCYFGPPALVAANDLVPGPGRDFIASDLAGGECIVVGGEFEYCAGGITQVDPVTTSLGVTTGTVLHAFSMPKGQVQTPDGDTPTGIVRAPDGTIFGGTAEGGPSKGGTVYRLTAPAGGSGPWTETVLHAFTRETGATPVVWVAAPDGSIFGTTEPSPDGTIPATVWRITPFGQGWTFTELHRFTDYPASAVSPLVRGPDGSIYATVGTPYVCDSGCAHGGPALFRLTPPPPGTTVWTHAVVYRFPVPTAAQSNLSIVASDGTIYGFTGYTGVPCVAGSCGRIWKLTPPSGSGKAYTPATLYDFPSPESQGIAPQTYVPLQFRHEAAGVAIYGVFYYSNLIRISEHGWR
jgi:hypothetical protein